MCTGTPGDVGVIDCTGTPENVGVIGCALSHPWMLELQQCTLTPGDVDIIIVHCHA